MTEPPDRKIKQLFNHPHFRRPLSLESRLLKAVVFLPVNGFDVHLQAVSTGSSMAALLAHKRLLAAMLGRVMDPQLSPG